MESPLPHLRGARAPLLTQAVPCRLERRLRQPALSEPLRVHAEQDLRAADNLASGIMQNVTEGKVIEVPELHILLTKLAC